jgi:lipid II:glycine glycyltransferase (peptidoglycan interpeptide bridge formation enzyme)
MQQIGWQIAGKPGSHIFYRSLGPLAISKIQRPKHIDLSWIKQFRRYHHTLTTFIEPGLIFADSSTPHGFKVEPYAHSCTSLVDLLPPESTILSSFSQKTRYNIVHTLKKNDLSVTTTKLSTINHEQLTDFLDLHSAWSKQKNVIGHPLSLLRAVFKSYAQSGDLHLCYHDTNLIGSLLILYSEHVATYYAAFASDQGYHLYAPTLLTWTAMETAKGKGCDIFDFGGIYDPRYPKLYKNWQGFTKFKSGFRPTIVSYPPTYLKLFW